MRVPLVDVSLTRLQSDPVEFLVELHQQYGDIVAVPGVSTILFGGATGPPLLFGAERRCLEVYNTSLVHELFGDAIFNLCGDAHRAARKLLWSGLVRARIDGYASAMADLARQHTRQWVARSFDLYEAARVLTLDVCAHVILGLRRGEADYNSLFDTFDTFALATEVDSGCRHLNAAYWRGRVARAQLRSLILRQIASNRTSSTVNVLSYLMAHVDSYGLNPSSIPDHLLALLIAARETTASLITWHLVEIANHGNTADIIGLELKGLLRSSRGLAGLSAAPNLAATLAEAERLHSPNAISYRRVVSEFTIGDYEIPTGWYAAYSPAASHLLPHLFNDPLSYCHRRFIADNGARRAASLLTFGGGIHACPGKHFAEALALATTSAVFSEHRMAFPDGVPAGRRYFPVKAPTAAIRAVLNPR